MYAKAKRTHLQLAYTAKQYWKHHNGSLIYAVCLVYYHILDSQHSLCEVLLKFVISSVWCLQCRCPVWSGYKNSIMQYLLHWTPAANVHHLTPWNSWPRCRDGPGCICCLADENLRHFLHSDVVYSCSFLAIVNFSDLLLLQNTHSLQLYMAVKLILFNYHTQCKIS